ncbi:hypothetical protein QIG81_18480, partial [Klebsiella pneumoniae]|uniref:hypothetical protein n=10 Tax=Klebsiella/Raoultella group TaxID=2890311 RepID=UPI00247FD509|nr:hypothetical protein [Klebsiella pneumoniae]
AHPAGWAFCVSVVRPACRHASPVALRLPGLQNRTPDKVRSTAFIASQNSVTNACGMVNRIVNLPDDTSRKIIISSYD